MTNYSKNIFMQFIHHKPKDIEIFDVTLRDGEQTPGVVFTPQEKIAIAEKLDSIGVDIIEAGFPVVSKSEEATVREIAHLGLNAKICCLARSVAKDVDTALRCDVDFVSIIGKHTGTKALKGVVKKMGYDLTHDQMCILLDRVKKCSESKKKITCDKLSEFIKELE